MIKSSFHKILFLLFLIPYAASAQFYVTGDDPGRLKWSYIESDNFKVIYPRGNDSLALIYGQCLEKVRIPVSRSMGYLPCGPENALNRKMPVVLHTYFGNNGSVAWAPRRMDLFAIPSSYSPEPSPWYEHLAIHELRHVSQMQFGLTKTLKPGNWIFGQMWNGLAAILYPGTANMEGDAVIAETALTRSGRGRTSDFLNYYRVAFDNGVYKKWGNWRFPSQKNYSPNHYALGYMCLGGMRYLYDSPEIFGDAMKLAARNPLRLGAIYVEMEKASGKKFQDAFMEVCDTLGRLWRAEADSRAPYISCEPVQEDPELYTDYSSLIFVGDRIYAKKKGHLTAPVLVSIDRYGKERTISRLAAETSSLRLDNKGSLWWSENTVDERWSLKTGAVLRRLEGNKKEKIGRNALRYNPMPSPYDNLLSTVRYDIKGGSSLDILDNQGKSIASYAAPDTLQLVETVWLSGQDIYASALSGNGYGIYHINLDNGIWQSVLSPQPVMIKDLRTMGSELTFVSDRTGVNELYHFNPADESLTQKTSIRHGGSNFCYSPDGKYLYYTSLTMKGNLLFRTPVSGLMDRKADFTQYHHYALAEKLAEQEKELAAKAGEELFPADSVSEFSEARKYRKFPHAFNVHSWAPVYLSVDNIMNMSFDRFYQALSLGASGIIQNDLSTAVGEFGYSAHKDPYNKAKWRHSGHVKFTYSGLYPVIEASVDFNDRSLRQYNISTYSNGNSGYVEMTSREMDAPYFQGKLSAYIPFNFSGNGWYKGFTPRISYTFTNDRFNTNLIRMGYGDKGAAGYPSFYGIEKGRNIPRQYLSASVRGYTMLAIPNSAVYPRWGAGLEIGASTNLGLEKLISPGGYVYGYGYLPGFTKEQGLRLTALYQQKLNKDSFFGQSVVNVLPRGLQEDVQLLSWISTRTPSIVKLTADYAIPVFIGDLVLGINVLAIKRLVVTPNFDCTFIGKRALWSAGVDLAFDLESIITIEFPISLGISYSCNGGFNGSFDAFRNESGTDMNRHFFGPIFNVVF